MKEVKVQRQQVRADKEYFTGNYGLGFRIAERKTGEVKETAATLEQAEAALARWEKFAKDNGAGPGNFYEILDNGRIDSKNFKEETKFKVY